MRSKARNWTRGAIVVIGGFFATAFVGGIALLVMLMVGLALVAPSCEFSLSQPDPNPTLTAAIDACDVASVEAEIEKGGRPFIDGEFNLYEDGPDLTEALACGPAMATLLVAYAVENGGGDSIVQAAMGTGKPEIVTAALDAGVDVDARDDAGDTALLDAVTSGDGAMLGLLLDRGADPDLPNDAGQTPLFRAIGLDRPLVVARLLAAGASPNTAATVTAFDILGAETLRSGADDDPATNPVQDAIRTLRPALGYSATSPSSDLTLITPLYLAVAVSSDEVVTALLDARANPPVGSGPSGHQPADAAELLGRTELAARIRAAS